MLQLSHQNLLRIFTENAKKNPYLFSILRPAGNNTGLVGALVRNPQQRKFIADILRNKYPNIEQVGFINFDPHNAELIMSGGEFCGNATSSAAHLILHGKQGKLTIKVSGVKEKLIAGVTESGEGFSQMPVFSDASSIKADNHGNALVAMEGITHYVDFDADKIKGLTIEEVKEKARKQMTEMRIDQELACGIIYVKKIKDQLSIHPIVYVRDADTLYYETACGSGTTALGLVLAKKEGRDIKELPIIQPSGLTIKVTVSFNGKTFTYAQIQSSIQKIYEGKLTPQLLSASERKNQHQKLIPRFSH